MKEKLIVYQLLIYILLILCSCLTEDDLPMSILEGQEIETRDGSIKVISITEVYCQLPTCYDIIINSNENIYSHFFTTHPFNGVWPDCNLIQISNSSTPNTTYDQIILNSSDECDTHNLSDRFFNDRIEPTIGAPSVQISYTGSCNGKNLL